MVAIDRTKKRLVTRYVDVYCDSATMVRDTVVDTTSFDVKDGHLYQWDNRLCYGTIYDGTSTDIVGSWKTEAWPEEIPADLKSVGCIRDTTGPPSFFLSRSLSTEITATALTSKHTYQVCPGNLVGPQIYFTFLNLDTALQVTGNTCKQTILKNRTFTDKFFGDPPKACPDPKDKEFTIFTQCMLISGFVRLGDTPAEAGTPLGTFPSGPRLWPRSLERRRF